MFSVEISGKLNPSEKKKNFLTSKTLPNYLFIGSLGIILILIIIIIAISSSKSKSNETNKNSSN